MCLSMLNVDPECTLGAKTPIASVDVLCVAQRSQEVQAAVLAAEMGWEDDVVRVPPSQHPSAANGCSVHGAREELIQRNRPKHLQ